MNARPQKLFIQTKEKREYTLTFNTVSFEKFKYDNE